MSKKAVDNFQTKISRNDRFAQMSHQEKLIEQKKREIQAKLEAKEKANKAEATKMKIDASSKQAVKSVGTAGSSNQKELKNVFSNDGSFLDHFKQVKDTKKLDSKLKSFNKSKDRFDKNYSEDRNKSNKATQRRSPSPKDRIQKRVSRFSSEKIANFEPKITINTSFSNSLVQQQISSQANFQVPSVSVNTQNIIGKPFLKNVLSQPVITYQNIPEQVAVSEPIITASPVLLNVSSSQIVQGDIGNSTLVITQTEPASNIITATPLQPMLTTVDFPQPLVNSNITPVPPPCLPTIELATIPPPNPIQVQNIPQPEPLNALNIPQPAPIQVQNIPTPSSLHLNKIPNPKPLDLMTIPTPSEGGNLCNPDFIKNIPPPNKSVPPPQIQESALSLLPQSQNVTVSVPSTQNILIHNMPPPNQMDGLQGIQASLNTQIIQQPAFSTVTVALPIVVSAAPTLPNSIPSLMAQPILPPPGMGLNINMNCPPPVLQMHSGMQPQMPAYVNQPPPVSNQISMVSVPPPNVPVIGGMGQSAGIKDMNAVFPPGTPEYEAMASLGRMVAQCGESIEDIVRQRKNQDPNLWFLFQKDSAAYRQYRQLIEQYKRENEMIQKEEEMRPKQEDVYEPEMVLEDNENVDGDVNVKRENEEGGSERKRKRKSRWGEKDTNIAAPTTLLTSPPVIINPTLLPVNAIQGPVMLSKVTRSDSGLLQYAMNTYGTTNLSEEDWKKAEDNYKISLLYQDLVKKREEAEKLRMAGKNKYDYDSDEETDGGTWEHRNREKEMIATQQWAQELNKQAEGKHHIGDFLPPEELKRFIEKSNAAKEGRELSFSDYKDFQIKEDNIGFKMLQKLGWSEGKGLGTAGSGIVEPVNKAAPREHMQGLGLAEDQGNAEDEYESYRKRMMLAYRFRPNPLNNPRRPYY